MGNLQSVLATAIPVAAMLGVAACTSRPAVSSCTITHLKITLTRTGGAVTGEVGGTCDS